MAFSAFSVDGSAEMLDAAETASEVSSGVIDVDEKKGYDEAEWLEYKDWFSRYGDDDDDYYDEEDPEPEERDPLRITSDGLIYLPEEKYGLCYVVHYIGRAKDLVIPKEINGIEVTGFYTHYEEYDEIHYFDDLPTVKTLTIEAKVENIPNVFINCPKLEKVTFPDTVVSFYDGLSGETCDWSPGAGCMAFSYCPKLKTVNIPGTIKGINGAAFYNTPWLNAREKKEKLVVVGKVLLSGRRTKGKVVMPKGVTYMAGDAFRDNKGMTELVVTRTINWSGNYIFDNCSSLKKITILNGVKSFPAGLCYNNVPKLRTIIIPPSMTSEGILDLFDDGDPYWDDTSYRANWTCYYYKGTPADKLLNSEYAFASFNSTVLPRKTKSFSVTPKSGSIEMKWKKVSTASGYQIKIATDSSFRHIVKKKKIDKGASQSLFCRVKGLKKAKKYYVKMRTYRTIDGKKYYGNYTKTHKVRVY